MSYIAQIRVINLERAIEFYCKKLDCRMEFLYEDYYAGVLCGDQMLHLKLVDQQDPSLAWVYENQHLHLMFPVVDVDRRRAALIEQGVKVSSIRDQPWAREFTVLDPDGHTLYFSQLS